MTEFPYILFNKTPEQLRHLGARGAAGTAGVLRFCGEDAGRTAQSLRLSLRAGTWHTHWARLP
jgi:hypothetical protein